MPARPRLPAASLAISSVAIPSLTSSARALTFAAATLLVGACALSGESSPQFFSNQETGATGERSDAETAPAEHGTDLDKATRYWGERYAKEPRSLDTALNYAKNLRALGKKPEAMNVLQESSLYHGQNRQLASEYGRLALEMGQVQVAQRVLQVADDPAKPDWRVLSALGTAMSKQDKQAEAIGYYERALTLAPEQPSILNNLAMAYAMKGEAAKGEEMVRRALAKDPQNPRMRHNLALMLSLQGRYDEAKVVGGDGTSGATTVADIEELRRTLRVSARPGMAPVPVTAAGAQGWSTNVAPAFTY